MKVQNKIIYIFAIIICFFVPHLQNVNAATLSKPANNLGLVEYLSFNEGTTTNATDFSGNRNNGTLVNMSHPASATSGWGQGYSGSGVVFDGTDDYVNFDGVADNVTQTSFSISMWVKTTWTTGFFTLWAVNTNAYGNETQIYLDSTNFVKVYDGTSDAAEITSSILVGDNKWHHVVYTRSGATGTLYVDSVSQGTHTGNDTFSTNDRWSLGQEWDAGPVTSDFFKGNLDEVRVYSRVLSQTDVTALYSTGGIKINSSKNEVVKNGLIGYWTLDGGNMTSTLAYDISASGNTLSTNGSPQKTTGKVGQSLNMDAVDDELFCTDANCGGTTGGKYDMGTRDWTVMAWIYPENGATSCNISGRVASKIGDDEAQGWFIGIANSYICGSVRNGGVDIFSTLDGSQVTLNSWNHIAIVFDRDGNMTRYLNGVQTGTQDSIASYNGISLDHPLNFCIGGRDGGSGCIERMFDGRIDEVKIYDRTLSASEVKQIYNSTAGSKINSPTSAFQSTTLSSGLVGYWSFNGLDVTDKVYDRSGQGNDGYHNGRATSTAKTGGKSGQALDFDGTTDYVRIGTPSSLNNLGPLTYSAWIYPRTTGGGSRGHILARTTTDGSAPGAMLFTMSNLVSRGLYFYRFTSGTPIARTTNALLTLNSWNHIAVTWDGSVDANNVHTYVNGVEATYFDTSVASGSLDSDAANPQVIGIRAITSPDRGFDGKIDEVRIHNRVLTASEIKQLYLMGR